MDELELLTDLFKNTDRQGPVGDAETIRALDIAAVDRAAPLRVADIGSGTGAAALLLAGILNARITAVDYLRGFLDVRENRAADPGVSDRIETLTCSVDRLPFSEGE